MAESLNLLEDVLRYARAQGADAADAVLFESADSFVCIRQGKQEKLERAESGGVGLRVFVGSRPAIVSSTDLSKESLQQACLRAIDMARVAIDDPHSTLAAAALWPASVPDLDLAEAAQPNIEWLQQACRAAEEAALATAGITNSEGAEAQCSQHHVALATSEGFARSYRTTSTSLSLPVIAGSGETMQRDYDYSVARHSADLASGAAIGSEAATRTLRKMNPRKAATCEVPVIFEPRVARSLLSSFASAISGSAVARGTSFLKEAMETAVFGSALSIIDDPHRMRGLSSRPFDAEGVANGKRALVQKGVLQSWLLDMRSAHQLGLSTTGHATRGLGSAPSPSSTNLYLEAGTCSPEDLIGAIESGFFVTETFGMGVNLVTGDYSQGASGFWIEKGEIAYPVSEVTIAGHLRDMFAQLTPANDLRFTYGINSPTVRIDRMTVAGA